MSDIAIPQKLRSDYYFTVCEREKLADYIEAQQAELAAERERTTVLQARLNYIARYVESRVKDHIAIADRARDTMAGKKQKVRASEASEILGAIRKEIACV